MPHFGPLKRKDLIFYLRRLGFQGPFAGRKHQFLSKDSTVLRIPNPHQADIGVALLSRILVQAHISRTEWESL